MRETVLPKRMLARKPVSRFTVAEYTAIEAASSERHEYWYGELYAMTGGTPEHSAVAQQVGSQLEQALRGKPCVAFQSDARVAVLSNGKYCYADAFVACAPILFDPLDPRACANPSVVVEVLSPSTSEYDRGDKLDAYRLNPALQDILLVDIEARTVEHWFRRDGGWDHVIRASGAVALGIGVEISVEPLWEKLGLLG